MNLSTDLYKLKYGFAQFNDDCQAVKRESEKKSFDFWAPWKQIKGCLPKFPNTYYLNFNKFSFI
jgi:hypothetical protein